MSAWDDIEDVDEDGEEMDTSKEKRPAKISYADKMIVSVMGAVFNILLAFVLSSILWFFGYERRDG